MKVAILISGHLRTFERTKEKLMEFMNFNNNIHFDLFLRIINDEKYNEKNQEDKESFISYSNSIQAPRYGTILVEYNFLPLECVSSEKVTPGER